MFSASPAMLVCVITLVLLFYSFDQILFSLFDQAGKFSKSGHLASPTLFHGADSVVRDGKVVRCFEEQRAAVDHALALVSLVPEVLEHFLGFGQVQPFA